jgi:DNA-binding transcriptional LysR family regulator
MMVRDDGDWMTVRRQLFRKALTVAQMSQLKTAVRQNKRVGRAGHLRIGASPSNVDMFLPDACSALLMEAPKVTLNVSVLDNDALLPALRRGEIDIALTHTKEFRQADLELELFRVDEFVIYSPVPVQRQ